MQRDRLQRWIWAIFLVGLAIRVIPLVMKYPAEMEQPEPVKIAISLATTGQYSDAYGLGVGPTAHCAPLHPLLLSVLIRIFGTGPAGALAIGIAGSTASASAFALLPTLAIATGLGPYIGIAAGLAGALTPINYWAQTNGTFDAPFSALFLAILCISVSRTINAGTFTLVEAVKLGVWAGLASLLNPAFIPVMAAWCVLFLLWKRREHRAFIFAATVWSIVIVVLAPWAIRNHQALGAWIWTRSNLPLEWSISNNDLAAADQEQNVRSPAFQRLHPFSSETERQKVHELGEVAYNRQKLTEAENWIGSHKGRFAELTLERIALFWVPRMKRPWQSVFETGLTIAAAFGLVLWFRNRGAFPWLIGAVLVTFPAIYAFVHTNARYRFPVEPLLYLAASRVVAVFVAYQASAGLMKTAENS